MTLLGGYSRKVDTQGCKQALGRGGEGGTARFEEGVQGFEQAVERLGEGTQDCMGLRCSNTKGGWARVHEWLAQHMCRETGGVCIWDRFAPVICDLSCWLPY